MKTKNRQYEESHPWITFYCDLTDSQKFDHELWMNIGEMRSKSEHIAGVPLQPQIARELQYVYLSKGVMGTTAIEGNTLSEKEIRQVVEGTLELPPSQDYLRIEARNIVEAVNKVADTTLTDTGTEITTEEIKRYNEQVLEDLELEDWIVPGAVRNRSVTVGRYRAAPAEDCEYLLERMCAWLNAPEFCPEDKNERLVLGILRAVLAHLYLAWIHPFGDGNGRTARLIEFKILVTAGFPTPASHLLSNHYNFTRSQYYIELDKASRTGGDISGFVKYAVQGFVDGLREQLKTIKAEQWRIAWRDHVYTLFTIKEQHRDSIIYKRQRHLVLDLFETVGDTWILLSDVEELTPRLAKDYATVQKRTLLRDIRALESMGLVESRRNAVRATPEIILAFLPDRRDASDLIDERVF